MSHEQRRLPVPPACLSSTSSTVGANSPYSIIEADVRSPLPLWLSQRARTLPARSARTVTASSRRTPARQS